jgi:hypothetical protein
MLLLCLYISFSILMLPNLHNNDIFHRGMFFFDSSSRPGMYSRLTSNTTGLLGGTFTTGFGAFAESEDPLGESPFPLVEAFAHTLTPHR